MPWRSMEAIFGSWSRLCRGRMQRLKPSFWASLTRQQGLTDGPNFPGQSHLPEQDRLGGNGTVQETAGQGGGDSQIDGRFIDPHASGHIQKDILV